MFKKLSHFSCLNITFVVHHDFGVWIEKLS